MQTGTPWFEMAQHAAGGRAVDVEHVSVASVRHGDDEGLSFDCETHVAEESFVENLVDYVAIVHRALRFAHYARACGGVGLLGSKLLDIEFMDMELVDMELTSQAGAKSGDGEF